jgi:hypothetical protein
VPPKLPFVEVAVLVVSLLLPVWPCLVVALIVVFPDGRPLTRAWGGLLVATGLLTVAAPVAIELSAGPLPIWLTSSALALPGDAGDLMAAAAWVLIIVLVLMMLPAVWSLILRYRAASDIGRLQLKWLVYAGCVFVATALIFWLSASTAYAAGSTASTAMWLLICFGATVIPLAASVAILHYHLYDIETIIGRTLVYGGLTAILAGMYTAGIRFFNWLFVELTGEDSDATLVLTTLVLATTFTPIKNWLEAKVKARRGVIVDPATAVGEPRAEDEAERIAERAAALVLARLGDATITPEPHPSPDARR